MDDLKSMKSCGHCAYFMPTSSSVAKKRIKDDKGDGVRTNQMSYWECACDNCKFNEKGRFDEDGASCDKFENKYVSNDSLETWRRNVNIRSFGSKRTFANNIARFM